MKRSLNCIVLSIYFVLFYPICFTFAREIKIATYNVQNLFDLVQDGTEYEEYVPNTHFYWNRRTAEAKYLNIARVIRDMSADILCLQEVESRRALELLRRHVDAKGVHYQYAEIADRKRMAVKCAVLSKFPIVSKREILVWLDGARNILEVKIQIDKRPLILFINHWKSKRGPESQRLAYAKALRSRLDQLPPDTDYVVLGDFNSNYNEYLTLKSDPKLNDTNGITGINHILRTIKSGHLVTEKVLMTSTANRFLYNLWLEIHPRRRWSHNFFGKKGTPDNIMIPSALYDTKGISYVDNSFDRFVRRYLFKNNGLYRWERARHGKGRHLGKGYSDHLPIYARFSTGPFKWAGLKLK